MQITLSTKQLSQIHTLLQEYQTASTIVVEEKPTGIGPAVSVSYYADGNSIFAPRKLLGQEDITDYDMW